MKSHDHQKLFSPTQIGPITLSHRIVMAPLTRSRSLQPGDIPSDLMREYYTQRASDGGLIISEATSISITGRGWLGAPGLYSDEQVEGWKKITAAVHAKGGHMFSQLWHTGRMIRTSFLHPAAGSNLHRTALSISQKFLVSSRITAKPLSERRRRNSKASNYMPRMAT
jgi:N-ethylmaleimide reductase